MDNPTRCSGALKMTPKMICQTCAVFCSNTDRVSFLFIAFYESVSTYLYKGKKSRAYGGYKYVFWRPKQSTAKNSNTICIIFEGMLWRCRIIQTKTDSFATNYSYLCTSMQNLSFLHGLVLELWACELWQKKECEQNGHLPPPVKMAVTWKVYILHSNKCTVFLLSTMGTFGNFFRFFWDLSARAPVELTWNDPIRI